MREIIFRGKRNDNGTWIYGNLQTVKIHGMKCFVIFGDIFNIGFDGQVHSAEHALVDPNTIGQYTGLADRKGNRIFEGDIVDGADFCAEDGYGAVGYDNGAFEVTGANLLGTFHENYYGSDFEVIGNIHDNPELLEGGEQDGRI